MEVNEGESDQAKHGFARSQRPSPTGEGPGAGGDEHRTAPDHGRAVVLQTGSDLQQRVREHTAALRAKNRELKKEIAERHRIESALKQVAGAAAVTGDEFFRSLVKQLAKALNVDIAFISVFHPGHPTEAEIVAGCDQGGWFKQSRYSLTGLPYERVLDKKITFHPRRIRRRFPNDALLAERKIDSSLSVPVIDATGQVLGMVTVAHRAPMPHRQPAQAILQILATRIAAELGRQRFEEAIQALVKFPDEMPSPVLKVSHTGFVLYANEGSAALLADWGCGIGETVPDDIRRLCRAALENGTPSEMDMFCGQAVFSLVFAPSPEAGYVNIYGLDISGRVLAETQLRESEERFRQVTEHIRDVFWLSDPAKQQFIYVSPAYEDIWGRDREELRHNTRAFFASIYPGDEAHVATALARAAVDGYDLTYRIIRPDGALRWIRERAFPVPDRTGHIYRLAGIAADITAQVRAQEEMRKLSRALEQTADAVTITGRDGVIEYVNPAFEHMTQFSRLEAVGQKPRFVKSGRHPPAFYQRLWATILGGEVFRDVFINRKKDGALYYEEKTITPLKNHQGVVTHFIATGKDITERMQTQERLHHLAYHDVLTELPNRLLFLERLTHALNQRSKSPRHLALLFLDVDRFKFINDTLGHDVGDQLLQSFATRLAQCVREGDTVARLGGDEFAILLEDVLESAIVTRVARKILETMVRPFHIHGHELFVSASIGISLYPDDGADPTTLLKHADTAMYRAKEQGRNNYQFYSADMSAKALRRLTLENGLRRAVERGEFLLHYQPQLSLASGWVIGAEALMRWEHPELGMVSPLEFIPLLEETGMIVSVGEWVLRNACREAQQWQMEGGTPLRVAINLSGRQFRDPGLHRLVSRVIKETGLPAHCLELEITESVFMQNDPTSITNLYALRQQGVRFAIDDFGTGYSSLDYLRRLPIDTLKIAPSFIREVGSGGDGGLIVKAIIAMARTLQLNVMAEGVETEMQRRFLQNCDCTGMQGFLFRPAIEAAAIPPLAREPALQ